MRALAMLSTIIASSAFAQGFCLDPSFADGGVFVLDVGGVDNVAWSAQGLDLQPDGRLVVGGTVVGAPGGRLVVVRLSTSSAHAGSRWPRAQPYATTPKPMPESPTPPSKSACTAAASSR